MEAANIVAHAVGREQRRLQTLPDLALPGAPVATVETLAALADRLRATGSSIVQATLGAEAPSSRSGTPDDARIPVRNPSVKGPLAPTGDWLIEKGGRGAASIAITRAPRSDDVTYEIVNFVDGTRTIRQIRDAVSAEFEPVDLTEVAEYVDLLARAGAITFKR
jgi:hypothetical protein